MPGAMPIFSKNLDAFGQWRRYGGIGILVIAFSGLAGCGQSDEWRKFSTHAERPLRLSAVAQEQVVNAEPVRALKALDSEQINSPIVSLGQGLFHDRRLSGDGSISCASCHDIQRGGDDGLATSTGMRGQLGAVNAPTVLNSGHNFRQFWDGRVDTLVQQALIPIVNPVEMGGNWPDVMQALSADEVLMEQFEASFGTRQLTDLNLAIKTT